MRWAFSRARAILWTALAGLLLAGPPPLRAQIPGLMNSTLSLPGGVQTFSIAVGSDGNIWLTDFTGNNIGRLTPAGVYTAFSVPTANAGPRFITNGPDGNLWFTENSFRQIGRITPAGVIAEFAVPGSKLTTLDNITAGPDGNIWFSDGAFSPNTQVGRIAPDGTGVTEFPIGGSMVNGQLAAGPDGNVWFSDHGESTVNRIGKITTDGVVTVYMLPSPGIPLPQYDLFLTSGLDGNLWFTQANSVGKITPDGTITQFAVPTANARPSGIVFAGDGNIWFNEENGGKVGQLVLSSINGSQATINENVLPANGYTGLFLLPAPQPPAAKIVEAPLAQKTCPEAMQLIAQSSAQPDAFLVLALAFVQCADLDVIDGISCFAGSILRGEDRRTQLLCTVKVTNNGPDAAAGVIVHYISSLLLATGDVSITSGDLQIGSLASGSSATQQFAENLPALVPQGAIVTASAYGSTFDPNVRNNEQITPFKLSLNGGIPVVHPPPAPAPPEKERGHTP